MEIGSSALMFLMDTWEGHLTPPEVASLADKASRGRDPAMVRAAAQLALSCLPHAHALNPNEIQRALLQCKEQSAAVLEQACLAVESAAKGGGVYPEVLFDVARRWFELYEETTQGTGDAPASGGDAAPRGNSPPGLAAPSLEGNGLPDVAASFVMDSLSPAPAPQLPMVPPLQYTLPYRAPPYPYIGSLPAFHHPHLLVTQHPAYLQAPPTYQYPPLPSHAQFYAAASRHGAPPQAPPPAYTHQMIGVHVTPMARAVLSMAAPPPAPPPPPAAPQQGQVHQLNQTQLNYLLSSYRVGLLAMETLARRVHDDRPQAKYARNPPYGEDVKWLLGVAKKLAGQQKVSVRLGREAPSAKSDEPRGTGVDRRKRLRGSPFCPGEYCLPAPDAARENLERVSARGATVNIRFRARELNVTPLSHHGRQQRRADMSGHENGRKGGKARAKAAG
ncbi:hypothetical protein HPB51_020142 [Rhipicephalus microplus]|uniref:ZSWIM4-8 C-terminal domain-containing protein n=1 Tax=Rhipicephalus microplus TaxID=6941 RepID=A0A9J6EJ14_RHIMP|nr:hypothetical protein HPB51_020142 [Rhipicephalus microplus]